MFGSRFASLKVSKFLPHWKNKIMAVKISNKTLRKISKKKFHIPVLRTLMKLLIFWLMLMLTNVAEFHKQS